LRRDAVHGVGANEQSLGPAVRQLAGRRLQNLGHAVPVALLLQVGNVLKIQADQLQGGRVQSAPASRHFAVDVLVIQGGGLPTHAPDQTDFFHAIHLCRLKTEVCHQKSSMKLLFLPRNMDFLECFSTIWP
jgi:hypothetical protein